MSAQAGMRRWIVYQAERFPILQHGPLILAFSFSALSFSALLRGAVAWPGPRTVLAASVTSLSFFLMLRIADEFKDYEEDSRYRPDRAVPRGLVSLRELGFVAAAGGIIQFGLAVWLDVRLLAALAVTWTYLVLMSHEFFVRAWLKARPFTYMWTHMLIMPLIDFYAAACDWIPAAGRPPDGLGWFLAASLFNGFVIETGRKIRAPGDEEAGVATYSAVWGIPRAVGVWLAALGLTGVSAFLAARRIAFAVPAGLVLASAWTSLAWLGWRFVSQPVTAHSRLIELASGLWTLALYLLLGIIPLGLALLRGAP